MTGDNRIIHLVRIARGIEAGGHYNVSKLIWALVYAEEVRASNQAGIPRGDELDGHLQRLIAELKDQTALVTALEAGLEAIRTEQPNRHEDIGAVYVSRRCGEVFVGQRPASTACDDDPLDLREFRPHYYLESMPVPMLLGALRTFPLTLSTHLEGLSEEQMNTAPIPGEWSLRELLVHLDVTQALLLKRARQFLTEDYPALKGVAAWTMTESAAMSVHEVFDHYLKARAQTVDLLAPLKPEDWWRMAYHEEFGQITLQEHASYFARHERSHVPQLLQIVRGVGAS